MTDVAMTPTSIDLVSLTLHQTLRQAAATFGDKDCIRTMDGQACSYREVLDRAERQAAGLVEHGVSPQDRVVVLMDNSIEMVIAWLAINLAGAVEVPCNTANRGPSLSHVLNNSGAQVAIIDAKYATAVENVADEVHSLGMVVSHGDVTRLPWPVVPLANLQRGPSTLPSDPVTFRDPAAIIYTSGTTGPAKGVLVPHAHMHTFAQHVVDQLEIVADDIYYVCLPMFHANAQFMQVLPCLMTGATIVIAGAFSASRWVDDLIDSGATATSLLGVMAQYIYNQPSSARDLAHSTTRMITIPMPAAIALDFEKRFGTTCIEAYGMTEVCLPLYRPKGEPLRPGSCGKVLEDWFEAKIVDPESDLPVPDGEVGEIVVRPKVPFTTFLGYNAMPERTVDAWRNLWFHTGDAARRDSEGYYYFVDRLNDRIRRKGENITTYDIELALSEVSAVEEAAVVAVPAAEGEDEIKAFLVIAAGETPDPVGVLNHCARRLPYFAVPRYLEIVEELPKTPTGKVLKRTLRQEDDDYTAGTTWDRESAGWTVKRGVPELVSVDGTWTTTMKPVEANS